jgi:hypothetical protein
VAAEGADGTLDYYWQTNATMQHVAGPGSTTA